MYWPSLNFSFTSNRFLTMEQIEIIHSVNLLISVVTYTLQLICLILKETVLFYICFHLHLKSMSVNLSCTDISTDRHNLFVKISTNRLFFYDLEFSQKHIFVEDHYLLCGIEVSMYGPRKTLQLALNKFARLYAVCQNLKKRLR